MTWEDFRSQKVDYYQTRMQSRMYKDAKPSSIQVSMFFDGEELYKASHLALIWKTSDSDVQRALQQAKEDLVFVLEQFSKPESPYRHALRLIEMQAKQEQITEIEGYLREVA